MAKWFSLILALSVLLVGGVAVVRSLHATRTSSRPREPEFIEVLSPVSQADTARVDGQCAASVTFEAAAQRNAVTATQLQWSPFGRPEVGWATYWPLIAHEIGTGCSQGSGGFAQALAGWQQAHGFKVDGVITSDQFETMKQDWYRSRPYTALRAKGVCPDPPPPANLTAIAPDESYEGKFVELRPGALIAYRQMVRAARRETPGLDRQALRIFSGFRSPEYDADRCAREHNCDGIVRADCSPHRTGLAIDLVVGQAPGYPVDSTADVNRLAMTQTDTYRWLVANAKRFGFVNYPFEPWHWEWTGEAVTGTQGR